MSAHLLLLVILQMELLVSQVVQCQVKYCVDIVTCSGQLLSWS